MKRQGQHHNSVLENARRDTKKNAFKTIFKKANKCESLLTSPQQNVEVPGSIARSYYGDLIQSSEKNKPLGTKLKLEIAPSKVRVNTTKTSSNKVLRH